MPQLIFKCRHVKGGSKRSAAHLNNLVNYVATREGVERIQQRENYVGYIARRIGSHGLFTAEDSPLVLSRVADEVANHPGTVWLPIISLQREDAARLGYDNAERWRQLLSAHAPAMAEAMKIPLEQFRWYAAFHDQSHHPHVHMVCYSADGKSGFLTKAGIKKIKSDLARDIFQRDLTEIYQLQTQRRDELTEEASEVMKRFVAQMKSGTMENRRIEQLMTELARRLKNLSGKKQYGYLKAPLKRLVDEIVDELERDPRVADAYDLWYRQREEVLRTYRDDLPERVPLSAQKEFKRIKNLVIGEAVKLNESPQVSAAQSMYLAGCATKLLHHIARIFQEQTPAKSQGMSVTVDSKLRRIIREKKIAMGHKPDDNEQKM